MLGISSETPLMPAHYAAAHNFMSELAARVSHQPWNPPLLFHYTGGEGLDGIVAKLKLRATHVGFMNDGSEYIHAVNRMLTMFELAVGDIQSEYLKRYVEYLMVMLADTAVENYPPIFVTCFTMVEDSFPHWKTYGRADGGFSVGFDRLKLDAAIRQTGRGFVLPVVYDQFKQDRLIGDLVAWILNNAEKQILEAPDPQAYSQIWAHNIFWMAAPFAALIKAQSFTDEVEYRLVYLAQGHEEIEFLPKENLYSAFVTLPIGQPPVHSIRVGPGVHQRLNMTATRAMLAKEKKPNIFVRMSAHRRID